MVALIKGVSGGLPTWFNLQSAVGASCPNLPEDVALVTFYYRKMGEKPHKSFKPDTIKVFRAVEPGTAVTANLLAAIEWDEATLGVAQDRKVSVAKPSGTYSDAGGRRQHYMIMDYNYYIKCMYGDVFPRIDKITGCPPVLARAVVREVVGTGT